MFLEAKGEVRAEQAICTGFCVVALDKINTLNIHIPNE